MNHEECTQGPPWITQLPANGSPHLLPFLREGERGFVVGTLGDDSSLPGPIKRGFEATMDGHAVSATYGHRTGNHTFCCKPTRLVGVGSSGGGYINVRFDEELYREVGDFSRRAPLSHTLYVTDSVSVYVNDGLYTKIRGRYEGFVESKKQQDREERDDRDFKRRDLLAQIEILKKKVDAL